jgi:hypothetical protein
MCEIDRYWSTKFRRVKELERVACFFCNVILLADDNAETSPFTLKV